MLKVDCNNFNVNQKRCSDQYVLPEIQWTEANQPEQLTLSSVQTPDGGGVLMDGLELLMLMLKAFGNGRHQILHYLLVILVVGQQTHQMILILIKTKPPSHLHRFPSLVLMVAQEMQEK